MMNARMHLYAFEHMIGYPWRSAERVQYCAEMHNHCECPVCDVYRARAVLCAVCVIPYCMSFDPSVTVIVLRG